MLKYKVEGTENKPAVIAICFSYVINTHIIPACKLAPCSVSSQANRFSSEW